jgi:hypothetical protein
MRRGDGDVEDAGFQFGSGVGVPGCVAGEPGRFLFELLAFELDAETLGFGFELGLAAASRLGGDLGGLGCLL